MCSYDDCDISGHSFEECPVRLDDKYGEPSEYDSDGELRTDGGRDTSSSGTERAAELIAVECPGDCEYTAQIACGTLSIATCPGCDRELKIDTDKWVHRCPETAADMVVSARDNDCPYCNRGVGDV